MFKYPYTFFNRRVCGKQSAELSDEPGRLFTGVLYEQLGYIFACHCLYVRVCGDLAAEASARGFFVISADPASARYSLLREMANLISVASR